jgi:hypothetical protein
MPCTRSLIGRMGDQRIIDDLARMERICLDLAGQAAMPEERAGLLEMAANYRGVAGRPAREQHISRTQIGTQRRNYRTELDRQGGLRGWQGRLISLRKVTGRHLMVRCRPYSKTGGRRFEPCHSCQLIPDNLDQKAGRRRGEKLGPWFMGIG